MLNKTPLEMTSLFEDMAAKGYDWGLTRRGRRASKKEVHSTESSGPLLTAKIDELISTLLQDRKQGKKSVMVCDWCSSSNHEIAKCQFMKEASTPEEQVSFVANARGNNNNNNNNNHP
ncbi:unnamed protein product [Linum trigynum]|uniref:Uncharacterized protein n=1 Tax=Linum trigynum TaxID=586398 RepID=A0AAV2DDZ8_9ROSI